MRTRLVLFGVFQKNGPRADARSPFFAESILKLDRFFCLHGIVREGRAVEILAVQIHGVDLAAAVGRVVIDAALRVPAGGVDRVLKLAGPYLAAALLLLDRAEDVEELPDARRFALARAGIGPDERRAPIRSRFGTKDSVRSTMPSSARPASQTAIRSTTTRSTRRASAWPG